MKTKSMLVPLQDMSTIVASLWAEYYSLKGNGYDASAERLYEIIISYGDKLVKVGYWKD